MALLISLGGALCGFFTACSSNPAPVVPVSTRYTPYGGTSGSYVSNAGKWQNPYGASSAGGSSRRTVASLYSEVRVKRKILSDSCRGRTRKSMKPTYITIHSTQNWSKGADADRHALALKNNALGKLSWHYSIDDHHAVQHLPTDEQGNHADYDGPGNKHSIGIEMCENVGNNRAKTTERTAKLAAWLMYKNGIPLNRVVPHYRWPRWGKHPPNKNCPHFLLDNGKPGAKWQVFLRRVNGYYRQIATNPSKYAGR